MARDFGPFPSKPMYEVVNRRMQRALAMAQAVTTGFTAAPGSGQGLVTAGTGAQLVIAAYPDGALVDGLWVENTTTETVTLTTNTASTNPRIDRLVLRLDMGAQTIAPVQIQGTPAATPQAPNLTRTATAYDLPLCQYRFPGSASAQNPGSIIDEREWLKRRSTGNAGYVTDPGGNVIIPHGLARQPSTWGAVVSSDVAETDVARLAVAKPANADAANIVIRVYRTDTNQPLAGNPVRLQWWAEVA